MDQYLMEGIVDSRLHRPYICIGSHAFAHKIFLQVHVTLASLYHTAILYLDACVATLCMYSTWPHFQTM